MNCNYKGKPTRHLVKCQLPDGTRVVTVNGKTYGSHATLESLVAQLTTDDLPEHWPIRLTHTIDRITGARICV
jgi:hypothetical protein